MDHESHFFSTPLDFALHFWSCSFKQEHVVSKSHVCEAVMIGVTQVDAHTFSLLRTWDVVCQLIASAEPC